MKRVVPEDSLTCPYCGYKHTSNEGSSEKYDTGKVIFYCAKCNQPYYWIEEKQQELPFLEEDKKHYIGLVVSYESAGGMGEHDAIEEGLRGIIEAKVNKNPEETDDHCETCTCNRSTQFKVEVMQAISEKAAKKLIK